MISRPVVPVVVVPRTPGVSSPTASSVVALPLSLRTPPISSGGSLTRGRCRAAKRYEILVAALAVQRALASVRTRVLLDVLSRACITSPRAPAGVPSETRPPATSSRCAERRFLHLDMDRQF